MHWDVFKRTMTCWSLTSSSSSFAQLFTNAQRWLFNNGEKANSHKSLLKNMLARSFSAKRAYVWIGNKEVCLGRTFWQEDSIFGRNWIEKRMYIRVDRAVFSFFWFYHTEQTGQAYRILIVQWNFIHIKLTTMTKATLVDLVYENTKSLLICIMTSWGETCLQLLIVQ